MEKINRNKFMDKITFLLRAEMYEKIELYEDKDKIIEKTKEIFSKILTEEK